VLALLRAGLTTAPTLSTTATEDMPIGSNSKGKYPSYYLSAVVLAVAAATAAASVATAVNASSWLPADSLGPR